MSCEREVIYILPIVSKMPFHISIFVTSEVKEPTLKPIKYSVSGLIHIPDMTNIAFQAIY